MYENAYGTQWSVAGVRLKIYFLCIHHVFRWSCVDFFMLWLNATTSNWPMRVIFFFCLFIFLVLSLLPAHSHIEKVNERMWTPLRACRNATRKMLWRNIFMSTCASVWVCGSKCEWGRVSVCVWWMCNMRIYFSLTLRSLARSDSQHHWYLVCILNKGNCDASSTNACIILYMQFFFSRVSVFALSMQRCCCWWCICVCVAVLSSCLIRPTLPSSPTIMPFIFSYTLVRRFRCNEK